MKVLIIEDERPASQKLIRLLEELDGGIEIAAVLRSVEESINWFAENPSPELIFMDIELEDGISFEIFEACEVKTPVIFTTAYDEYTLRAFKVNSVDYLLKPIGLDELRKAVEKFNSIHRHTNDYLRLESIIRQLQPKTKERFLIRIGEHYKSVAISSISCFYIMERSTFILTDTGRSYPIDYSLDKIEQMTDPHLFFRANRNVIVNFNAIKDITAFSSSRLKINLTHPTQPEDIIVSRERVAHFKKWMDR